MPDRRQSVSTADGGASSSKATGDMFGERKEQNKKINEMLNRKQQKKETAADVVPPLNRSSPDVFDAVAANANANDVPGLFDSPIVFEAAKSRKSYTRIPKRKQRVSVSYSSEYDTDDDCGTTIDLKRRRQQQTEKRKQHEQKIVVSSAVFVSTYA